MNAHKSSGTQLLLLSLISLGSASCVTELRPSFNDDVGYEQVTICQLNKHPEEFFGKPVRLQGVYETDGVVSSGLFDLRCDGNGVIESKFKKSRFADETVKAYAEWHSAQKVSCNNAQMAYCALRLNVDVAGYVTKNALGEIMLEYSHVYMFEPIDENEKPDGGS